MGQSGYEYVADANLRCKGYSVHETAALPGNHSLLPSTSRRSQGRAPRSKHLSPAFTPPLLRGPSPVAAGPVGPTRIAEATPTATPPKASATMDRSATSSTARIPRRLQSPLPWLRCDTVVASRLRRTTRLGEKYRVSC